MNIVSRTKVKKSLTSMMRRKLMMLKKKLLILIHPRKEVQTKQKTNQKPRKSKQILNFKVLNHEQGGDGNL